MARLPRYTVPGQPQHVIQRGNNRAALFGDAADYRFFHRCLVVATRQHLCRVHAYVLMTNHVHLLLTADLVGGIGKAMQSVGRRYVQHFNRRYARTGTLWEGRYRATLIDTEEYLLTCHRYVELNPVRAGLVDRPEDYRWCSHGTNAFGARDPLVTPHERYIALGHDPAARRCAYLALFRDDLDDRTLRAVRRATNSAWALGGERFQHAMRGVLNRRAAPLPPGPKRSGSDSHLTATEGSSKMRV